jgi:hypothetical protein
MFSIPVKRRAIATAPLFLCLLLAVFAPPALSQSTSGDPFRDARFGGGALLRTSPQKLPEIRLRLTRTIELPGPLARDLSTILLPTGLAVPTAEGWRLAGWDSAQAIPIDPPAVDATADLPWAFDNSGRNRFFVDDNGRVQAERCCGAFRKRWHPTWRARLPGRAVASPLFLDKTLVVPAADNSIYGLRSRNGHRIWSFYAGQRVSRPLVAWNGPLEEAVASLLLIVPDTGDRIIVLDPTGGRRLAQHVILAEGEKLLGIPTTSERNEILIPVQRYDPSRAALLVFVLEVVEPENDQDSSVSPSTLSNG